MNQNQRDREEKISQMAIVSASILGQSQANGLQQFFPVKNQVKIVETLDFLQQCLHETFMLMTNTHGAEVPYDEIEQTLFVIGCYLFNELQTYPEAKLMVGLYQHKNADHVELQVVKRVNGSSKWAERICLVLKLKAGVFDEEDSGQGIV